MNYLSKTTSIEPTNADYQKKLMECYCILLNPGN